MYKYRYVGQELKRIGILVQDMVKLLLGTVGRHMSPVVARPRAFLRR